MAAPANPPEDASNAHKSVLRAVALTKTYAAAAGRGGELSLFRNLDLHVNAGETVAIIGQSGSGKSSLLHLLAGLDRPSSGQVWIENKEVTALNAVEAAQLRNHALGFVWQFHYLLPEFSAVENIALPLLSRGEPRPRALATAGQWLHRVELDDRAQHRSGELSGGEQQRVALARALVTQPRVLLADEPTGDLDDLTAAHLFELLQRLCHDAGLAAVIVTHNADLAHRCDRVLRLRDGKLSELSRRQTL